MDKDSKTDISRSGRVRKKPKNLADFETQDNIDDDDITVKVSQNSDKIAKNVSLKCQINLEKRLNKSRVRLKLVLDAVKS